MENSGCVFALLERLFGTKPAGDDLGTLPYQGTKSLFSSAERSFYGVLLQAAGSDYTVFAKVRLLDLFYLPKGTEKPQSWRNRVQSKHVDFVLCEPKNLKPVIVVELDDASHDEPDREARDDFVGRALQAAGIRLVRVRAKQAYTVQALQALLREAPKA